MDPQGSPAGSGGTHPRLQRAARVLVVEDDEGVRDVLAVLLNIEGCEARTASDGEAALALLRSWQPDLILLDVVMPGMDGPAFVRAYRETSEPHAPIILLTGNEDRGDLVAELGAVASLPKPFTVEAFLDVLNKFITC